MDVYKLIKEQRKNIVAPVDSMGCGTFKNSNYSKNICQFQILISLLLSSQTKDEITYSATKNLDNFLKPLCPKNILLNKKEDLHKCIAKVGFHNKKINYLIEISKEILNKKDILKIDFDDFEMPCTLKDIVKLPGVGNKMAFLYLQHGFEINTGIGVDTHVHRISNKIGLVKSKTPEQTRIQLEKKFDSSEYRFINNVFVGFGQEICTAKNPKCKNCFASAKCPKYDF